MGNHTDDDSTPGSSSDDDDRPDVGDASSPIIRLIEGGASPSDQIMAGRLRRLGGDPHLMAARLIRAIESEKESSGDELRDHLERAIQSQDDRLSKVERATDNLKTGWGFGRWLLGGIGMIALGLLAYVADKVLAKAELEGESKIKIEYLERRAESFDGQLRALYDRCPGKP